MIFSFRVSAAVGNCANIEYYFQKVCNTPYGTRELEYLMHSLLLRLVYGAFLIRLISINLWIELILKTPESPQDAVYITQIPPLAGGCSAMRFISGSDCLVYLAFELLLKLFILEVARIARSVSN